MTREPVEAMIQKVAETTGRKDYYWKQHIVDLTKLLNLDSGLNARKELAQELRLRTAVPSSYTMDTAALIVTLVISCGTAHGFIH